MAQQVSRFLCISFFLTWAVVPVLAQGALSAKVSSFQPQPVAVSGDSDRVRDGLTGPVRRVRTEVVKVSSANGSVVEGDKRLLLETAEYDLKGNKTQNQYFPVAGSTLTGREVYKYDDKGNISEMTLLAADGSLISKEIYKYDFDSVGNWTKMTTSVAVVENGKINFEPTECTYRTIFYYLDEKMTKMLEPAQPGPSASASPVRNDAKTAPGNSNAGSTTPVNEKPRDSGNSQSKSPGPSRTTATELPKAIAIDKSKLTLSQPAAPDTHADAASNKSVVVLESEAPPPSSPKPILKPVSHGVLNGSAISLPPPAYPDVARRMRSTGTVVVEVVIDENGKVIAANAVSGPTILRDVAVQAALRARFSPTKLSGQPVKVSGTINYNFTLAQ